MNEGEYVSDEPALARLAAQVADAREALLAAAKGDPEKWWTASELRQRASDGWPPTAVTLALSVLVRERQLEMDPRRRVRLVT